MMDASKYGSGYYPAPGIPSKWDMVVSAYPDAGRRTADIMSEGMTQVGCKQCGQLMIQNLRKE